MSSFFSYPWFKAGLFGSGLAWAAALFTLLTLVYSLRFMRGRGQAKLYYLYISLSAACGIGALLANNLLVLLICWGFLGALLYLLINLGGEAAAPAGQKTLMIVGGTDALMLLGVAIIYAQAGTLQMDRIHLSTIYHPSSAIHIFAYLCIACACFAKAGAMPFHSWIPDCAEKAPLPAVAFLPAALDKLLGIYLLARASLDLFALSAAMNIFLMLVGAFTIIAAVMMAMMQHNLKRLLGFHAVSQVGYMVLGIGTATPIGIAGGIFHMLNNALYKSCLFFCSGNVEYRAKTAELERLGGLARFMPLTYISFLVASLSISGLPPFNGFVSKWMVYQGLVERLPAAGYGMKFTLVLSLAAALLGSSLTLASFIKLLHAVFLGQERNRRQAPAQEAPWQMWLPCVTLAGTCVLFGVFAFPLPLKYFILPLVKGVSFSGAWYAGISTLLILAGMGLGVSIFRLKLFRPSLRRDAAFIGAEALELSENRVSGAEFYNTLKDFSLLKYIYGKAEAGLLDIYEQGRRHAFGISAFLQGLHNGVLPTYLAWVALGMAGLLLLLVR
jgi:formate hydrogenlyase subunit 3/multisubunit Na+/H+ antiporter MnhD subunit